MKTTLTKVNNIYTLMKGDKMVASSDSDFQTDYEVMKLSKENCDEIFGVFNVNKLVQDYMEQFKNPMLKNYRIGEAFSDGFNKAMELNKDKLFTVEDVKKAYLNSHKYEWFDDLIKSLQQPIEIEVEVKTISVGHCNCPCHRYNNMTHFSPCCYPKQVYKLDENGCLILKKK
jgi:hypothetical protein